MIRQLKLAMAVVGFAAALAAAVFDNHILGWVAIALLVGSFLLKLYLKRQETQ